MIEEKELPFLILIEEKLIEVNSDSIAVTMGDFKDIFIDQSHFNNIARILVKHNLAKEPKGLPPNIVAIIKSDETGHKRIQDIFNSEQEDKRKKDTVFKTITANLEPKKWYSLQSQSQIWTIVSGVVAALALLFSFYTQSDLENCKQDQVKLQTKIDSLANVHSEYIKNQKHTALPYQNKTNPQTKNDSTTNK